MIMLGPLAVTSPIAVGAPSWKICIKRSTHCSCDWHTVGDSLKDVAGPSLNIYMKLTSVTALLIASILFHFRIMNTSQRINQKRTCKVGVEP